LILVIAGPSRRLREKRVREKRIRETSSPCAGKRPAKDRATAPTLENLGFRDYGWIGQSGGTRGRRRGMTL
jgi:hypothetical protein